MREQQYTYYNISVYPILIIIKTRTSSWILAGTYIKIAYVYIIYAYIHYIIALVFYRNLLNTNDIDYRIGITPIWYNAWLIIASQANRV
jgi:hypothetical protein